MHADISNDSELQESLRDFEPDLDLPANGKFGLQHFSYNNFGVLNVVFGHLNKTNFTGISVRVVHVSHGSMHGHRNYNTVSCIMHARVMSHSATQTGFAMCQLPLSTSTDQHIFQNVLLVLVQTHLYIVSLHKQSSGRNLPWHELHEVIILMELFIRV